MSMAYIREHYGVPAKRGCRVRAYYRRGNQGPWVLASEGRITSASNCIHINGVPFHPTYGIVYLNDDGTVLHDTREESDE